jgi:hypothetical protein
MRDFKELAAGIEAARISLLLEIPHPCGVQTIILSPAELEDALKDKDACIAHHFGVTKDHYLRWIEFLHNPQCMAKTRKGRQCQSYPGLEHELDRPDKFDPNRNYVCHSHEEYSEKVESGRKCA